MEEIGNGRKGDVSVYVPGLKSRCAESVLIRGVEGIAAPARLTKALGIDKRLNGKAASRGSGLWIEDRGVRVPSRQVERKPRVGVDYAGEWARKPYRFIICRSKTALTRGKN